MTEDSAQVSILSIGYGNDLFRANTTEHRRLVACAEEMREVHTLVLGASAQKARDGKLFLYGVGGSLGESVGVTGSDVL